MKFISNSRRETQKLASDLAPKILKKFDSKKGLVIGFEGELGAGKTTFIQGLAKGLGIKDKIKSPTFVLMREHKISRNASRFTTFYHLDCYRLNSGKDLEAMNFKEIISRPENVIVVEWPERVKEALPKRFPKIHMDHLDRNKRKLTITGI